MLNMKVLEAVTTAINNRLNDSENLIMSGQGITDFATYRYSVGYVKGLVDAKAIMEDVIEKLKGE